MTAILAWIQLNPEAFKSFLKTFFALLIKLILQVSGLSEQLENWNAAALELVDLIVYGVSAYGVIVGSVHASRGPALTPVDQAAAIVAAVNGPPVADAVQKVKSAVEVIASSKEESV